MGLVKPAQAAVRADGLSDGNVAQVLGLAVRLEMGGGVVRLGKLQQR